MVLSCLEPAISGRKVKGPPLRFALCSVIFNPMHDTSET